VGFGISGLRRRSQPRRSSRRYTFTDAVGGRVTVNAGVGPCHLTILLGDFGDGSGVTCPDIETRRGTMRLQGTAQPLDGRELDDGIVDSFAFYWTRRR
jgi:hypothetical protein